MQDQQDAMIYTPEDIVPRRTVPQTTEQHGQKQVQVRSATSLPVSTQGDVQIVPQPSRKAYVPSSPEFPWAYREERKIEVPHQVKAQNPDLIILDAMMEGRHDGFEVARELKKDPQSKHTPILMFTSIKERSGTDFKSEAGDPSWLPVEGYLDKTAEPDMLIAEVERLLSK